MNGAEEWGEIKWARKGDNSVILGGGWLRDGV